MKIVVIGGTGLIGSKLVETLKDVTSRWRRRLTPASPGESRRSE
jgi:uncharacterized protein YbjT (DUF2867 family)